MAPHSCRECRSRTWRHPADHGQYGATRARARVRQQIVVAKVARKYMRPTPTYLLRIEFRVLGIAGRWVVFSFIVRVVQYEELYWKVSSPLVLRTTVQPAGTRGRAARLESKSAARLLPSVCGIVDKVACVASCDATHTASRRCQCQNSASSKWSTIIRTSHRTAVLTNQPTITASASFEYLLDKVGSNVCTVSSSGLISISADCVEPGRCIPHAHCPDGSKLVPFVLHDTFPPVYVKRGRVRYWIEESVWDAVVG